MPAYRLITVAFASTIFLTACSGDGNDPTNTDAEVVVSEVSLPVAGAVYRGADPHSFLDESVTLFCGTHGLFSSSVEPPNQVGTSVVSEYLASFVGELVLEPPVVSSVTTYELNIPARMAENITLSEIDGAARVFSTELVTFELRGSGMPENVIVRESPDFTSAGVTTITSVSEGMNRVESHYDVWLDISLDGGRSWHRAQNAVRMTLQPG